MVVWRGHLHDIRAHKRDTYQRPDELESLPTRQAADLGRSRPRRKRRISAVDVKR